jgi:hypothetical protein
MLLLTYAGFSAIVVFNQTESKLSIDEKTSVNSLSSSNHDMNPKAELSSISLTRSQSKELNPLPATQSTTHYIQPISPSYQTSGLLTKATLVAINKVSH